MPRPIKPQHNRRADLSRAIGRAKPGDTLRLEDLALAWGVTKPAFVNIKKSMEATTGFPAVQVSGRLHLYPAKAALAAMLAYETRNDHAEAARAAQANAILGRGATVGAQAGFAPSELAALNKIAADIEERERKQREYIPAAEVSAVAAEVFSLVSGYLGGLENHVDPNGRMPIEQRAAIHASGRKLLAKIHGQMKELLEADAQHRPDPVPARSPRRTRARR